MNLEVYLTDGSRKFYENVDYVIGKDSGCLFINKGGERVVTFSPSGWTRMEPDAERPGKPYVTVIP